MKLSTYIVGTDCINRPPTKMEKEFIKEFFTYEAWAEHIQYQKRTDKEKYFVRISPFDLETISKILFFEVMNLAKKEMVKLKNENFKLNKDIQIQNN